VKLFEENEVKN